MRSSLYGSGASGLNATLPRQHELQEEVRNENEVLITSLGESVLRMKAMAGGLGGEVQEQNQILKRLNEVFGEAHRGVERSATKLRFVMTRYGWKHTFYFALLILVVLYIVFSFVL